MTDAELETTSARTRAYRALRQGILEGRFAAGTFVEETVVCTLAQVSRTPVREALNRLAVEGMIDLLPRRGAMVRHVTAQELDELYEVRRLVEGHAVRRLCAARHPAPAEMHSLNARMRNLTFSDLHSHIDLNRQFHHELVESAGNGVLTRIFEGMHTNLMRVSTSALSLDMARSATIHAEHQALLDALDAHDETAALQVLDQHLRPIPQVTTQLPRG